VQQLESLVAYQVACRLSRMSYQLTRAGSLRDHRALASQIQRAAISIPANIAEGYALGTKPQWVRHLRIALGSAAELRSHLRLLADLRIVQRSDLTDHIKTVDRLIGLVVGLLKGAGATLPRRET
jgi:four helix bundle protein